MRQKEPASLLVPCPAGGIIVPVRDGYRRGQIAMSNDINGLDVCTDCGTVFDRYRTKECPVCTKATVVCQNCGGSVSVEVEWRRSMIEGVRYECDDCHVAGTAEVDPRL